MCASCSPHRITIPRAFIVRPPKIEVIDLTGDSPPPPYREEPEEEGAEGEVRICEECLGATPRVVGSGSRPVEVPRRAESRRRRLSTQGGRSLPPTAPYHNFHRQPPQLDENDYCPICHRALPYLSDPTEAGREAHIAACISAATSPPPPSATLNSAATGRSRSYTNGGRMVVWNAGEKDTKDPSTGEVVECVICFEEFVVGTEIARLECLCRYHKKCIRTWFDRKGNGECPTHAIHE